MNEKLNKKLAEWVEFYQVIMEFSDYWHFPQYAGGKVCGFHPPNFPESLDACFKWLVPKLIKDFATELEIHFDYLPHYNKWTCMLGDGFYDFGESKYSLSIATGETLALALCLAIEKLINKEER